MLQPHAINLLKRLGERVVNSPEKYYQFSWGVGTSSCYTACCFAGHLCLMVDGKIPDTTKHGVSAVAKRARTILRLDARQAKEVFFDYTPVTESEMFNRLHSLDTCDRPDCVQLAQRAQKFLNEWIEKETRA